MIRKMLKSIVERSEDITKEDEVIEEGFFIFQNPEGEDNILIPYELREGKNFTEERDKAATTLYKKEFN